MSELFHVLFVTALQLELHVLLEYELHLLRLLLNELVAEASLEQMPSLLLVVAAVLALHVHVDGPYVHPLGVVAHDAFKHGPAALGLPVPEL